MQRQKNEQRKKAYVKPNLRRVTLKPEESLAGACKTPSQGNPAGPTCDANSCFNLGS